MSRTRNGHFKEIDDKANFAGGEIAAVGSHAHLGIGIERGWPNHAVVGGVERDTEQVAELRGVARDPDAIRGRAGDRECGARGHTEDNRAVRNEGRIRGVSKSAGKRDFFFLGAQGDASAMDGERDAIAPDAVFVSNGKALGFDPGLQPWTRE